MTIKLVAYNFNSKGKEINRLEQSFDKMMEALVKVDEIKNSFLNWEVFDCGVRVMSNFKR